MLPIAKRLRLLLLGMLACSTAFGQARDEEGLQKEAPVASSSSTERSEVPQVPGISGLLHGVNAGLTLSGLHDNGTGWATLAQPAIGFSFNDVLSLDITVPIYMYRLAPSRVAAPKANAQLIIQRAELGDTVFGLHAQFLPPGLQYQATFSMAIPTGDVAYGLTSGRTTFDFNNQLEHSFRWMTPTVELGVGDSSTLVNRLVNKNYSSLGPLAHFQAGMAFPLPRGLSFQTDAYEQLPIGDQKIYGNMTRRGQTALVVTGRSVTEDNGFTNSLDIPMDGHTTISGFYSRSLRFRDDIVSVGLTYVLRGAKPQTPEEDDGDLILRSLNTDSAAPSKGNAAARPGPKR